MAQIKLTVNEEKTRVCRVPDETFDFLGYTFGREKSPARQPRASRSWDFVLMGDVLSLQVMSVMNTMPPNNAP